MSEITIPYNLGRLGRAGDEIEFHADAGMCAALASIAKIPDVPEFSATIVLKKLSPTGFEIRYALAARIVQTCVVTLDPLTAVIVRDFTRELHYAPDRQRGMKQKEIIVAPEGEEPPEEIDNLHYDLAGPLMEEFLLAIDPYPRAPDATFTLPESCAPPSETPFAVLKKLKS
jgi:hypothetical protein